MRVEPIEYDDLEEGEIKAMFATFYRNRDTDTPTLPNHYKVEAYFPEAMGHILSALRNVREEGDLPIELSRKIMLAVAMANDCEYCTGVFCTTLTDHLGSEEAVLAFQEAFVEGDLDARERAILEFAVKLNDDPNAMTEVDFDTLRDEHGLTDKDLVQILFIVNIVNGYNRVTNAFDCEFESIYHDTPWLPPFALERKDG